jgi:hypothetical protein
MMKFVISFAVAALVPISGAQAESADGKAKATGCHPEWNKGGACRIAGTSGNTESPSHAAKGACHPEWSKGRACAVRVANAVREDKAATASSTQPVRVANSE